MKPLLAWASWVPAIALLVVGGATACTDSATAPGSFSESARATLIVQTETATDDGAIPDPDGYLVYMTRSVMAETARPISGTDTLTSSGLVPGTYTVRLDGLAQQCRLTVESTDPFQSTTRLAWSETRTVSLHGVVPITVGFRVHCVVTGDVVLKTNVWGPRVGTHIRVEISDDPRTSLNVPARGTSMIPFVQIGSHRVRLRPSFVSPCSGVISRFVVEDGEPVTVTLEGRCP